MDAWSSPWNDDDVQQKPSSLTQADQDDGSSSLSKSASVPFSSLNTFDASDPWSTDATAPVAGRLDGQVASSTVHEGAVERDSTPVLPEHSLSPQGWRDESIDDSAVEQRTSVSSPQRATPQPPEAEPSMSPSAQQALPSYDPWAAPSSSNWGAEQDGASVFLASGPEPASSGWGASNSKFPPTLELEERFTSTHISSPETKSDEDNVLDAGAKADQGDDHDHAGTNLGVWAAEASSREEKAHRLGREEIDKLKVDARKLISSINTEQETQASFAHPSSSDAVWTDLFGSQGTQRDKLHHLQTPPSALVSSSGALRLDLLKASPATLDHIRSSIARTENRGVKLSSVDNNTIWQRGTRPVTKADWLPDKLTGDADSISLGKDNAGRAASMSSTTSGPGWMQTSSNDTRSSSGPSFLASFFKSRQASATLAAESMDAATSKTSAQMKEGRNSFSSTEASPATSSKAQFEPYQDSAENRYTDDPTGPDLMSLDRDNAPAGAAGSKAATAAASAQGAGLLSRWRSNGLFKSAAKKPKPSWQSASLGADDLDWLDGQETLESNTGTYRYDDDEDDSFTSFRDAKPGPHPSPPQNVHHDAPTTAPALDLFESLSGPPLQAGLTSSASPTATSSARSSMSATRMSGEGGMMTIRTNLGRASSLARKSAASPLQPPPQTQTKRMSFAPPPPPRASAATPLLDGPGPLSGRQKVQAAVDPFADFMTDAPSQQQQGTNHPVRAQQRAATEAPAPAKSSANGLTADDLLFFDNL